MNIRVIPLLDAWAIRSLVIGIRSPEALPAPARLLLKHLVPRSFRFRESRKPLSMKKGMLGPAFSGTERTPDLMAEAGLVYLAGWTHDDQPTPMKVKSGKLITMPYSVELNDSPIFLNNHEGDYFFRICKAQFDQLYREGEQGGRVMCIAIHPWRIGVPHRVKYLDAILRYIMSHDGVSQATADQIADYYMANCYDKAVAHAAQLNK